MIVEYGRDTTVRHRTHGDPTHGYDPSTHYSMFLSSVQYPQIIPSDAYLQELMSVIDMAFANSPQRSSISTDISHVLTIGGIVIQR